MFRHRATSAHTAPTFLDSASLRRRGGREGGREEGREGREGGKKGGREGNCSCEYDA